MLQLANDDYLWKQLHFEMINEAPYPVATSDAMEVSEEGDQLKSDKEKFIANYKKALPAPQPLHIQQQTRRPILAQTLFQATKLSSMASRASNGRCYVQ